MGFKPVSDGLLILYAVKTMAYIKMQNITCITSKMAVIYTHRQTTQTAESMINQLTAIGRIGAKK